MSDKSLMVAMAAHDGRVEAGIVMATACAFDLLGQAGIPGELFFNTGESLVTRARCNIAKVFMNSACDATKKPYTHLMMIDTDMDFAAEQILDLLGWADDEHEIIMGVCPQKHIDWAAAAAAAAQGVEGARIAEHATRNVAEYAKDGERHGPLSEVTKGGGAFCLVARTAFEKFAAAYPDAWFIPDYAIGDTRFDRAEDRRVWLFFDTMLEPETKRYLSEDYYFCRKMRDAGVKSWVHRGVRIGHIGKFTYPPNCND